MSTQEVPFTILLAEEDLTTRHLLTGHLKTAGYRVLTARNSSEAMALAQTHSSDLLMTDLSELVHQEAETL